MSENPAQGNNNTRIHRAIAMSVATYLLAAIFYLVSYPNGGSEGSNQLLAISGICLLVSYGSLVLGFVTSQDRWWARIVLGSAVTLIAGVFFFLSFIYALQFYNFATWEGKQFPLHPTATDIAREQSVIRDIFTETRGVSITFKTDGISKEDIASFYDQELIRSGWHRKQKDYENIWDYEKGERSLTLDADTLNDPRSFTDPLDQYAWRVVIY